MTTSSEDARLLFARWLEEGAALRIRMRSTALIFEGVGAVQSVDANVLNLGRDGWQLVVPLNGASYSFSDPREAPAGSIRDAENSRYEMGLALDLSTGDRLALMELKEQEGEPASEESD